MLIVKYESKNFFGVNEFHEDKKKNETFADIKRAFQFLKKNHYNAIQIDNVVLAWNKYGNFEELLCRRYDDSNYNSYTDEIVTYDSCKKFYYDLYRKKEAA